MKKTINDIRIHDIINVTIGEDFYVSKIDGDKIIGNYIGTDREEEFPYKEFNISSRIFGEHATTEDLNF
jgi:hypothetical protein